MFKHTISIGLITIMAITMAAPLIHINCDMPCCEMEKTTCCESNKVSEDLEGYLMNVKNCDHSQFVPIISGPKSNQKFKDIDYTKPTYIIDSRIFVYKRGINTTLLQLSPKSLSKFITPLLL